MSDIIDQLELLAFQCDPAAETRERPSWGDIHCRVTDALNEIARLRVVAPVQYRYPLHADG